jgi:hypothetical protein
MPYKRLQNTRAMVSLEFILETITGFVEFLWACVDSVRNFCSRHLQEVNTEACALTGHDRGFPQE